MKNYFEILKSQDLINGKKVNVEKIYRLSRKNIEAISNQLLESVVSQNTPSVTGFSHSASLNLAGDPYECPEIGCRSRRLDKLARFAALHSSRVYISNFFDDFMHYPGNDDMLRYIFAGNVALSIQIMPFLESGIISFSPLKGIACPDCLSKIINGKNARKRETERALLSISKELLNNTELIAKLSPEPIIEIHGKPPYFDCISVNSLENPPKWLKPYLSVNGTKLPLKIAKRFGYHTVRASRIFSNVSFELSLTDRLGSSALFDDPLHISFINKISKDPEIDRKNSIALKYMTTIMPFADKVPITKILELRKREPESFLEFQKAYRDGILELEKSRNLKETDARGMYAEIIQPALNRLDLTFKNAQRSLLNKLYRNTIASIGSLSVGVLSGSITDAFIPALAGTIFAQKAIKSTMELGDEKADIRNNKFYFLWKVKQEARNTR